MSSGNQPPSDSTLAATCDSMFGAFFKGGQSNSSLWGGGVTLNGPPLHQQPSPLPLLQRPLAQLLPAPAVDTTAATSGNFASTTQRASMFNKYAADVGVGSGRNVGSCNSISSGGISDNGSSGYASNSGTLNNKHHWGRGHSDSNNNYLGAPIAVPPTARRQASSSTGRTSAKLLVAMPQVAATVSTALASSGVVVDEASASPGIKSVRVHSFPASLLDQIEDLATPVDHTLIPHADLVNFSPQSSHNQPADKRGRPPAAAYHRDSSADCLAGGETSGGGGVICGGKGKKAGFEHRCAMCHRGTIADGVSIPVQNKQVCTDCDTSVWRSQATHMYFKWCKGCKRFHNILMFREKLQTLRENDKRQLTKLPSKCDPCRQRGRLGYRSKKEGEVGPKKRGPKGPKSVTDARKLALLGVTHLADAAAAAAAAEGATFSSTTSSSAAPSRPSVSLGASSVSRSRNGHTAHVGFPAHGEHVYPGLALDSAPSAGAASAATSAATSASAATPPLPPPPALFYGSGLGDGFSASSHRNHNDSQDDNNQLNSFLDSFGSSYSKDVRGTNNSINIDANSSATSSNSVSISHNLLHSSSSNHRNKRARTTSPFRERQSLPPRGGLRLLDNATTSSSQPSPGAAARTSHERLSSEPTISSSTAPALQRAPAVVLSPTDEPTPHGGLRRVLLAPSAASERTETLMHL